MKKLTDDEKYNIVIKKNTFYFYDPDFEESYEGHISSIKDTLLVLKNKIFNDGLKKEHFITKK